MREGAIKLDENGNVIAVGSQVDLNEIASTNPSLYEKVLSYVRSGGQISQPLANTSNKTIIVASVIGGIVVIGLLGYYIYNKYKNK